MWCILMSALIDEVPSPTAGETENMHAHNTCSLSNCLKKKKHWHPELYCLFTVRPPFSKIISQIISAIKTICNYLHFIFIHVIYRPDAARAVARKRVFVSRLLMLSISAHQSVCHPSLSVKLPPSLPGPVASKSNLSFKIWIYEAYTNMAKHLDKFHSRLDA